MGEDRKVRASCTYTETQYRIEKVKKQIRFDNVQCMSQQIITRGQTDQPSDQPED